MSLRDEPAPPSASPRVTLTDMFEMHAHYVWSTLRRLGVPRAELEDVTHDVFMHVQRHLDEYDAERPARPWLFGFAFRVASAQRRKAATRRETLTDVDPIDRQLRADERLEADQDRQLLLSALGALDLERRAVLVMSQIDEVPIPEVAVALGIPLNTAYSRLRLGRAELAAEVKRLRAKRGDR